MTWAVASADAGLADANGPVSFIEQEWLRRAAAARSPRNGGASESSALWVKTAISSHTSPTMTFRAPSAIREQQLNREHTLMLNDQDLRQLGLGLRVDTPGSKP